MQLFIQTFSHTFSFLFPLMFVGFSSELLPLFLQPGHLAEVSGRPTNLLRPNQDFVFQLELDPVYILPISKFSKVPWSRPMIGMVKNGNHRSNRVHYWGEGKSVASFWAKTPQITGPSVASVVLKGSFDTESNLGEDKGVSDKFELNKNAKLPW